MIRRRSLTPSIGVPVPGLPPTRRAGGARRNVSYRVVFFRDPIEPGGDPIELTGWALNISRGGLRAIVEDRVDLGEVLEVSIAEEGLKRRGRIVWTQEEPDGMIVGVSFLERLEDAPPGVDLDSSAEIAPGELAKTLEMTEDELESMLAKYNADEAPDRPREHEPDGGSAPARSMVASAEESFVGDGKPRSRE